MECVIAQVCKQVLRGGHEVHVVSGAPEWVFRLDLSPPQQKRLLYRQVPTLTTKSQSASEPVGLPTY